VVIYFIGNGDFNCENILQKKKREYDTVVCLFTNLQITFVLF